MSNARDQAKELDKKIVAGFKQQIKIDRVPATPFKGHAALKGTAAGLAILALYIYGWGDGIVTAFQVLYGREMSPRDLTPEVIPALTERLIKEAIIITGAIVLFLWLRTKPTTRKTVRSGIQNFSVAFIIVNSGMAPTMILGLFLERWGVQTNNYPHPEAHDGLATFLYIISGANAGPSEEILMVALVVILMRKLNLGWAPIMIVAIILRLPFHMYYGWTALALVFWVIASVLFYKFTNRIWTLVLAHATKNALGGIIALGLDPYAITALLAVAFIIYGLIVVKNHLETLANTATPGTTPNNQQITR